MNFFSKLRLPYREDSMFSVLTFLVFILPLAFSFVLYEKFETPKWALWLVFTGCALFIFFRHKKPKASAQEQDLTLLPYYQRFRTNRSLLWILGVFGFWAIISTFWSVNKLNSILGFYPRLGSGLLFFFVWIVFIVLLLTVINRERFIFLAKVITFDALLVALFGILQSLGVGFYDGVRTAPGLLRAPSFLGNPNFSSMFLVMVLPFVLFLFSAVSRLSARIYYAITALSILICCVMLSSRGSLLALGLVLIVTILSAVAFRLSRKFLAAACITLILTVGFGYAFLEISRPNIASSITLNETNISLRFFVWDIARQGILQHSVTGIGLGNFQILFERQRGQNLSAENGIYDDAHNYFLQIAATGGLPLLLCFLVLLGYSLTVAYRFLREHKDPLMAACIAAIVAFAVAGSFTPVVMPCMMLLGVCIVGCCMQESLVTEYRLPLKPFVRRIATVGGLALVAAGICFISAEYLFIQSYNQYFSANYQKSYQLVTWAIRLNPSNQYYYIYRAGAAASLGKAAEVSRDVATVIRLQPQDAKTYVSASNVYLSLFAVTLKKDYLDQSLAYMTKSVELDKFLAPRYSFVGYLYYLEKNNDQALEYTKTSLALNSKQIPAWMLLGRIYQAQNKRPQMLYALEHAYNLNQTSDILKYIYTTAQNESDVRKVPIPVAVFPGSLE